MAERPLVGGITNKGAVSRDGDHLLRPSGPQTGAVHEFLRALRRTGFTGAPMPIGVDDDGRERLEFIVGDVPTTPYPVWVQSEQALASVAKLLRSFHDAARNFDPSGRQWNDALADPMGGPIVCHNDTEFSNIVFSDGIAVALIDFEFAAPGRRIYDLAQLARLCVPIDDEVDQRRLGWQRAERPERVRLVADAYGLDRNGRRNLLGAMDDALDRIETMARRSIANGEPGAVTIVQQAGGIEKYDRRRKWWDTNREAFRRALH